MTICFRWPSFLVLLLWTASTYGLPADPWPDNPLLSADNLNPLLPVSYKLEGAGSTSHSKVQHERSSSGKDQMQDEEAQREVYMKLRRMGYDEVSNTPEARMLRNFRLRKIKRTGFFRKKETSLAQILFPKSRPVAYSSSPPDTNMLVVTGNLLQSKKSLALYDISDHPAFAIAKEAPYRPTTMGAKLEGYGSAFKKLSFNFVAKRNQHCTPFATAKIEDLSFLRQLVEEQYRIHFQLDDLPVLMRSKELNYAIKGVPIGFRMPSELNSRSRDSMSRQYRGGYHLYNHFKFTVTYNENPKEHDGVYITGFDIQPFSINIMQDRIANCREKPVENHPDTYLSFEDIEIHQAVMFTYEIEWVSRDLEWEDRWDIYFVDTPDNDIHNFSMFNSQMCVVVLALIIARFLHRTFRRDMMGGGKKYNGWREVHADVFRLPHSPLTLATVVGTGVHLLVTTILTMLLNILGFISTMETGDVVNAFVILYGLCGFIGGYVSSRVSKLCGGENCARDVFVTSTWPSFFFLIVFVLFNQLSSMIGSSADWFAVLELTILWTVVLVPLSLLGAKRGDSSPSVEFPTKTSTNVRPIPKSKWTRFKLFIKLLSGLMPFSTLYVELFFVMHAVWYRNNYMGLEYLLAQTLLAVITCAEFSICICYLQLNAEDHQWWWNSVQSGAAVGTYFALYTIMYWSDRLELVGWYSHLSFLTCMLSASLCVAMVFGAVGFLSCLYFTRSMYGTMRNHNDEETGAGK